MNQTSVRIPSGERSARIAALRAQVAKLEGAPSPTGTPAAAGAELIAVPGALGRVLPGGGLARRQVAEVNDCPALVAELIAAVSAAGGFVAVVGWPQLSLAQVTEAAQLERIVTVPDPGADPWQATTVLLEGMDLVIHRAGKTQVPPSRARPVLAKLKQGRAALLTCGPHLPGAGLDLRGQVTTYRGIGRGTGRIRGLDIEVEARTKQATSRGVVAVGQARRLELA